jgi:Undecaprenyl-phosphate glucose phosphotransferase
MPTSSGYRPIFAPVIAIIDFIIVVGASVLAHSIRFGSSPMEAKFQALAGGAALLVIFCLTISGVYDSWRGRRLLTLLKRYTLGLGLSIALLTAFLVFTRTATEFSRLWLAYLILLIWAGGVAYRSCHHFYLRVLRQSGKNLRNILVLTTDIDQSKAHFNQEDVVLTGYNIAAYLTVQKLELNSHTATIDSELKKYQADEVWLNLPLSMGSLIKDIVYELRHQTVDIRFFPDFEDIQLLNHKASHTAGHFAIDISCTPLDGVSRQVKRLEDIIIGIAIGLLITPLCLTIALLIKLTSPGPVLFKQNRHGLDGKLFRVYKFRTMKVHTEENGSITQAQKNDPRITKIGSFLRRTSLDELPQFLNVLQGRMSIVGPRPHALDHNEYYKDLVESYMWRHKVKPGITGLAQVRGYRGETDTLEKMEKRVECDLEYINNWSLWLDIKVILLTTLKGFINKNAY